MVLTREREHSIRGVPGRMFAATVRDDEAPGAFCSQRWISEARDTKGYGPGAKLQVDMRFDDECRNSHNTFAITGDVFTMTRGRIACGCLHDEIAVVFPELQPLLKWHLVSADGPMHYIANTVFFAGDRDYHGLRKGERAALCARDGSPIWALEAVTGGTLGLGVKIDDDTDTARKYTGADTVPLFLLQTGHIGDEPPATPTLQWVQKFRVGEGKERELDKARDAAVWPEATDEDLSQEPEALRAALEARHASLMTAFKQDVTNAGFLWDSREIHAGAR